MKLFNKNQSKKIADHQLKNQLEAFDQIRSAIFPMPRSSDVVTVQFNDEGKEMSKVHKHYIGDITIFYQVDRGTFWEVLLKENLPPTISLEEIDHLAYQNLTNNFRCEIILSSRFLGYEIYSSEEMTACSLLLPNLWGNLSNRLEDDLVVSFPARDSVLIVEASKKAEVQELKQLTETIYQENEKPVSRLIYQFSRETHQFSLLNEQQHSY
ncbi:DUF1444 family protein [Enterococcus sp. AZ196]|uniref:DUF1444 family protein n=1 Tax=Enterococcus sp. AZ196 TaxID=2774659 RepID=UPI003D2DA1FF